MEELVFLNRDLSWLSFNERVLLQAARAEVPLLERIKFLSIYSSNLDEFYRVRIPVLMAVDEHRDLTAGPGNYELAKAEIGRQQEFFGQIIHTQILPALSACGVRWVYNENFPEHVVEQASHLFFTEILAYIHTVNVDDDLTDFFAENNKLYQAIILMDKHGHERLELVNVPSDVLPRFYAITNDEGSYVVFLEDIMKQNMTYFFPEDEIKGMFNLKITRDAELNPENSRDEEDMTAALERQLESRDLGFATRFLYEPGIPLRNLYSLIYGLNLQKAAVVAGGRYHNLKDLNDFPLKGAEYVYPKWPAVHFEISRTETLFELILKKDILVNVPYQSYDPVLRFFNEAANDVYVTEIYATLYRVAERSRIVSALMTAARNGRKVVVMVELKARFDEANNIKWAKQMKAAGVKIIYSNLDLKVHAKIALVKRMVNGNEQSVGLLATGNLNENTARFYTDQVLLTSHRGMLKELELLFGFLSKSKKSPAADDYIDFQYLLVAQFNLMDRFLTLIDREIEHARSGRIAGITIKLNNLEEKTLIAKLYEASQAGVVVKLIVRGICCLVPGLTGLSENITVTRIVDRYLEHGRIFIFENNGAAAFFMGSTDWMNRNIYSRIEVCFPVLDSELKRMIRAIINLQLNDDVQQSIYLFLQQTKQKHI